MSCMHVLGYLNIGFFHMLVNNVAPDVCRVPTPKQFTLLVFFHRKAHSVHEALDRQERYLLNRFCSAPTYIHQTRGKL